jgi:hypothetical protein
LRCPASELMRDNWIEVARWCAAGQKIGLGSRSHVVLRILVEGKRLRGTMFDPFAMRACARSNAARPLRKATRPDDAVASPEMDFAAFRSSWARACRWPLEVATDRGKARGARRW